MHSPPLRQLDIFAQMVAAGDAARCASDLGIDTESLLEELASLELRLGYRLFEDPGGRARLTEAGRKTARAMTLLAQDESAEVPAEEATCAKDIIPAPPSRPHGIVLAAPPPVFGHVQEALAAFDRMLAAAQHFRCAVRVFATAGGRTEGLEQLFQHGRHCLTK